MTKKRFKNVEEKLDWGTIQYFTYNDEKITDDEIEDLVNQLLEENEQSKMMIATLRNIVLEQEDLEKENKELEQQLIREERDKKRLMSYLMKYKGFTFDEIVEDFLDEPYYDNWWENEKEIIK